MEEKDIICEDELNVLDRNFATVTRHIRNTVKAKLDIDIEKGDIIKIHVVGIMKKRSEDNPDPQWITKPKPIIPAATAEDTTKTRKATEIIEGESLSENEIKEINMRERYNDPDTSKETKNLIEMWFIERGLVL